MMKQAALIIFAVFLTALFAGGCGRADDPVVATVNGEAITLEQLRAQYRVLRSVRPAQEFDKATRDQLLDQMVRQELLVQEARARGLDRDPSLVAAIDGQRERLKKELQEQIRDAQAQLDQLDGAVRSKALIDALVLEFEREHRPSPAEVEAYYRSQAERGQTLPPLEQVRPQVARQIMVDRLVREVQGRYEVRINQEAVDADATAPAP